MRLPDDLTFVVFATGPYFRALCPDLPGCATVGRNFLDASEAIRDKARDYLRDFADVNWMPLDIELPRTEIVKAWITYDSGRNWQESSWQVETRYLTE